MTDRKAGQVAFRVATGTASQAGVSRRPTDSSDDVTKEESKQKSHSPHGLPLSAEEYEQLKSRARFIKTARTPIAQRDPSIADVKE